MDCHRETENRWLHVLDLCPRRCAINGSEHSVVVLYPKNVRIHGALDQAMDVLDIRIELLFRWIVLGSHALAARFPGFYGVSCDPYSAGRYTDRNVLLITRVYTDRMNAWVLGPILSPLFALGVIPKRTIQFPRVPIVFGFEETAGHCSTPEHSRLIGAAGRESPDQFERPFERFVEERNRFRRVTLRHWWILWRSNFIPRFSVVAGPMEFDAEVAMIECRKEVSI